MPENIRARLARVVQPAIDCAVTPPPSVESLRAMTEAVVAALEPVLAERDREALDVEAAVRASEERLREQLAASEEQREVLRRRIAMDEDEFADLRRVRNEAEEREALLLALIGATDVEDARARLAPVDRLHAIAAKLEELVEGIDSGRPRALLTVTEERESDDPDRCPWVLQAGQHRARCKLGSKHDGQHVGEDVHGMRATWPSSSPDASPF